MTSFITVHNAEKGSHEHDMQSAWGVTSMLNVSHHQGFLPYIQEVLGFSRGALPSLTDVMRGLKGKVEF